MPLVGLPDPQRPTTRQLPRRDVGQGRDDAPRRGEAPLLEDDVGSCGGLGIHRGDDGPSVCAVCQVGPLSRAVGARPDLARRLVHVAVGRHARAPRVKVIAAVLATGRVVERARAARPRLAGALRNEILADVADHHLDARARAVRRAVPVLDREPLQDAV